MDKARRKELVRDYLEARPAPAVFAVRCAADGSVWVGGTKNPDKQQNSIWFQLRGGNHPARDLQDAWKRHGADAFTYDILEEIEEDSDLAIARVMDERVGHWRDQLKAGVVRGR